MQLHRSWLFLGLLISLAACNPLSFVGNKSASEYKLNPTPKQRYDITMTIANAPGTFASVEGTMLYSVINTECLPPPNSNLQGTSNHMTRPVSFVLTRVSNTEYIGTIHTDLLLDEDYYGRGVCRWQFQNIDVKLGATGAEGETRFLSGISVADLISGKNLVTYFWKQYYPRADVDNFPESGDKNLNNVPEDKKDDFFSITLTPKEVRT